jgi:hypothetical protein
MNYRTGSSRVKGGFVIEDVYPKVQSPSPATKGAWYCISEIVARNIRKPFWLSVQAVKVTSATV